MPKRKCVFTDELRGKYPSFQKQPEREIWEVICVVCNSNLSIAHKGAGDLEDHLKTAKHKKCIQNSSGSSSLRNYVTVSGTDSDKLVRAAEGTLTFHTIKHHHSFKSMDCTVPLLRKIYDDSKVCKQVSCSRTKSEAIVTGVLAPHSIDMVMHDLDDKFFGVATDASNHGATKLFPVVIQYFDYRNGGIQSKIIDLQASENETSDTISNLVTNVLTEKNILSKCVAFCGDNCNTNFGGMKRKGCNNVFSKLKTTINPNLVGVGCPAHVLNNTMHHGADSLPLDMESIVVKVYNYFSIYTVRVEALKEFCSFVDIQYQQLLYHSKTRWLSLFPAVDRILKLFQPLKAYFLSQERPPVILVKFFENELGECYLLLLHSLMSIFHSKIELLEKKENSVIEVLDIMTDITSNLKSRLEHKFIPFKAQEILNKAQDEGLNSGCDDFSNAMERLYSSCIEYLEAWMNPLLEFSCFQWMKLKAVPTWEDVSASIHYIQNRGIAIDDVRAFDQFCNLKKYVETVNEQNCNNLSHQIWSEYFLKCSSIELCSELLKIAQFFFSIPGHNANVERIFSLIESQWTKERNRLSVDTVRAIMLLYYNFQDMSCSDFHSYLLKNNKLLDKIGQAEKYK